MSIFNKKHREAEKVRQILADYRQREKSALWGGSVVISLNQPTMASGGLSWRIVDLLLKVTPPDGKPFTARTTWKVQQSSLGLLQPGSEISVKIVASDPQLIYPNIQGAEYLVQT